MKFLVVVSFFFLVSCQVKPTTALSETGVRLEKQKFSGLVCPETVVFDTRSTFDFNLNHVPGSINLAPEDFIVDRDPMDAARRLSLYGVGLKTPVLVIGDLQNRVTQLAWEISQLGVENVETVSLAAFKAVVHRAEPIRKNGTLWTPSGQFGKLNYEQFKEHLAKQLQNSSDGLFPMSRARAKSLQNPAVGRALIKKILILKTPESRNLTAVGLNQVTVRNFPEDNYFDSDFFMVKRISMDPKLTSFDSVYLMDSSVNSQMRALILKSSGARSVWIVH